MIGYRHRGRCLRIVRPRSVDFVTGTLLEQCSAAAGWSQVAEGQPALQLGGTATREQLVVVRVRAFSCNYRDRGFLALVASGRLKECVLGSEFAGEVLAVGRGVRGIGVGNRVMGKYTYDGLPTSDGLLGGVFCNSTSTEYLVVHASRLLLIPDDISWISAAAFSLNAQTAAAMVRRAEVSSGDHVTVFGATSSVGLALIQMATAAGAVVSAVTSRPEVTPLLRSLGAERVHELRQGGTAAASNDEGQLVRRLGEASCVFDPFCDVHFSLGAEILGFRGRYVTCGIAGRESSRMANAWQYAGALAVMIMKNITVVTNCLGTELDLETAVDLCILGQYQVVVDSVFQEDNPQGYLMRTFQAPERVGKVVMEYSP